MIHWKYDSPRYTAQVPGLQFVNDLHLDHHRFPRSYLLPQQVSHSGGELGLSFNDLRGLLVHNESAEGDIGQTREGKIHKISFLLFVSQMNKLYSTVLHMKTYRGENCVTVLPLDQDLQELPQPFLELRNRFH